MQTGGERLGGLRYNRLVQQAWYTGWKKFHGIEWQSVVLSCGLVTDLFGGCRLRHNDLYTLLEPEINVRRNQAQADVYEQPKRFQMYGDSI